VSCTSLGPRLDSDGAATFPLDSSSGEVVYLTALRFVRRYGGSLVDQRGERGGFVLCELPRALRTLWGIVQSSNRCALRHGALPKLRETSKKCFFCFRPKAHH
jgi:hypothetical protein